MGAFVADPISQHIGLSPEGFAICVGSVVGRTGMMEYKASELGFAGGDALIRVWRSPEELFSKTSLASGEGKPIVSPHPGRFVSAANWANVARGHMQNLRPSTQPLDDGNYGLLADLVIADASLVEQVKLGLKNLSLAYDCEYIQRPDGDLEQVGILYNHLAVVPRGRGQNTRIMDSEETMDMDDVMERLDMLFDLLKGKPILAKAADRKPTTDGRPLTRPLTLGEAQDLIAEQDRARSFEYGERINAYGRALRERRAPEDCRPSLRRRATDRAAEEDQFSWADKLNARGRELRERK